MWILFIIALIFVAYKTWSKWVPIVLIPFNRFLAHHVQRFMPLLGFITARILRLVSHNPVDVSYEILPGGKVARYYVRSTDGNQQVFNILVRYDEVGPQLDKVIAHYENGSTKNITQSAGLMYDLSAKDIWATKIEIWATDLVSGEPQLMGEVKDDERLQIKINELDFS